MNKILFLDIDGPMIPERAYDMTGQTKPVVTKFDPCAVGLLNSLCHRTVRNIVIHSSWLRHTEFYSDVMPTGDVLAHCVGEGITEYLFHHTDPLCKPLNWRYDRVREWLSRHPEVDDYVIVDDVMPDDEGPEIVDHFLHVDFEDGFLMKHYRRAYGGDWKKK